MGAGWLPCSLYAQCLGQHLEPERNLVDTCRENGCEPALEAGSLTGQRRWCLTNIYLITSFCATRCQPLLNRNLAASEFKPPPTAHIFWPTLPVPSSARPGAVPGVEACRAERADSSRTPIALTAVACAHLPVLALSQQHLELPTAPTAPSLAGALDTVAFQLCPAR